MYEYAAFLDDTASRFVKTDADNASNFTNMWFRRYFKWIILHI
jgi:hypothetical protein